MKVTRRRPTGNVCECVTCGLFFGSPSAFDRHLAPVGCNNPATAVTKRTGERVLALTERKDGPTWVLAGDDQRFASPVASRQDGS